jgi:hypothetical protein
MEIERATKQVQSLTGLIGILGSLLAAIAALNEQLRDAVGVFADLGVAGLLAVAAGLLVVGAMLLRSGRRRGSRLLAPEALRLDPRNPEHLVGRGEDVRLLREKCTARPLVFLVGDSGSGKSALVQAGLLPAARAEGRLLPVYLDMADLDWEAGPQVALADRFWRALSTEERKALGAERPPAADRLGVLLAACYATLGRTPLIVLDQIDDYQLRHRDRFLPRSTRSWLPATELVGGNAFWALLAAAVAARHAHLLLVTRSDNADGLESLRLLPDPVIFRLDPLPAGFVLGVLDRLTSRPADTPPVIESPERGWSRLRERLADDLERGGAVLPQQLKVALLGLTRLTPLSALAYDRAGGIEGLEARYIEDALARAAARAGLAAGVVRGAMLRLVDREGVRRGPPLSVEELTHGMTERDAARLPAALEALEETEVLRRRGAEAAAAFQLDHDYLARGLLRAEANADRWKAQLRRRAREFADARGSLRARWRAMLGLREQLAFLAARLLGRFRYGEERGYALLSAAPYATLALLAALLIAGSNTALEVAKAEAALATIAPDERSAPFDNIVLAELAKGGLAGRAWFAYRLLADPDDATQTMKAARKAEPIVRAVVGLDEERAVLLADRLLAPLLSEEDLLHDVAAAVVPQLPARAVARLPPPLPDAAAQAFAEGRPLDQHDVLMALGGGHPPEADTFWYDVRTRTYASLRASRGRVPAVASLARSYADLASRLPPDARAQIAADLIEEIRAHREEEQAILVLSLAEAEVARTLPDRLAGPPAGALLDELRAARGVPSRVYPLAMALAATVPAAAVDPIAAAGALVMSALRANRRAGTFVAYLAEAHATLTLPLPSEAEHRAEAVEMVLDTGPGDAAAPEPPDLPTDLRLEGRSWRLRLLFEPCWLSQCFASFAGAVLDAARGRPFAERAGLVIELLKVPASARMRLTEALLARLRAEPGAEAAGVPDGGLWELVAWAEAGGLEPGRPLDPERLLAALPD